MWGGFFKPDTTFADSSTMLQRFGLICWWTANGFAVGSLIIGVGNAFDSEWYYTLAIAIGFGAFFWLSGRAALFLFASR